ncbi:hypothetical protein llg_21740 [Luteolibacter sp. LG18]|nr:hypothetical protein llg_21740 [Luteolibacter sp. LG18]
MEGGDDGGKTGDERGLEFAIGRNQEAEDEEGGRGEGIAGSCAPGEAEVAADEPGDGDDKKGLSGCCRAAEAGEESDGSEGHAGFR